MSSLYNFSKPAAPSAPYDATTNANQAVSHGNVSAYPALGEVRRGKFLKLPNGQTTWSEEVPDNYPNGSPFHWYNDVEGLALCYKKGVLILDINERGSVGKLEINSDVLRDGDTSRQKCVQTGKNGTIVLWDLETQRKLMEETDIGEHKSNVCFLGSEERNVVLADDVHNCTMCVWDIEQQFATQQFEAFQSARAQGLIRDPNSPQCFLVGCTNNKAYYFDSRENTGKPCRTFLGITAFDGFSGGIFKPLSDPYPNSFCGISTQEICVWDIGNGKKLNHYTNQMITPKSKGYPIQSFDSAAYYSNMICIHWKTQAFMFIDLHSESGQPLMEVDHNSHGHRYLTMRHDMVVGQNYRNLWTFKY